MSNKKIFITILCIAGAGLCAGLVIFLNLVFGAHKPTEKVDMPLTETVVMTTHKAEKKVETTKAKTTTAPETVPETAAPIVYETEAPAPVYVAPATEAPATEPPQTEPPQVDQIPIGYLPYSDQDAIDIAKVMYLEARGIGSDTEKACIAWTILNRVDNWGGSIYNTIRQPNQFAFYESTPVWDNLYSLAHDVLSRWSREKAGETNVGRVLPRDYMWYYGDGSHNYFRNAAGTVWNYSYGTPYGW